MSITLSQTDTIIYSFHNDGLVDRCRGECLEKGCNRRPLLHDFSEGLPPLTPLLLSCDLSLPFPPLL
jgi:hypothetical protein